MFCIHEIQQFLVAQGVPEAQVVGMNKGGCVDIGEGFKATMVNAIHSSSCGMGGCVVDGGSAAGFVVNCPNGGYHYAEAGGWVPMR